MKRVVIILLLITIFTSLLTATLIVRKQTQIVKNYTLKEPNNFNIEEETPPDKVLLYKEYHLPINDNTSGSTLSQTFDVNPIKFTEHIYEDDKTYAIYLQIDGLTNESIEEAINDELKSQIIEFGHFAYDEIVKAESYDIYTIFEKYSRNEMYSYNDKPNKWNSCVSEKVLFNGNGVISIAMTDNNNSYLTKYSRGNERFLNYNLSSGKKLKIEELFTKDFNVVDAFSKTIYSYLGEGEIKRIDSYYYNEITGEKEWWRN